MPRIRQNYERYDSIAFQKEIFRKLLDRYGDVSVRALADEIGLPQSTMNLKLRHNHMMLDIRELRKIIPVLRPDPGVVLALLGYTGKDLRLFIESYKGQ